MREKGGCFTSEISKWYEPGKYTDDDVIALLHDWSKSKNFKDNIVEVAKYNSPHIWMQLACMVKPKGLRDLLLRNRDKVTILEYKPLRFKVHPNGLLVAACGSAMFKCENYPSWHAAAKRDEWSSWWGSQWAKASDWQAADWWQEHPTWHLGHHTLPQAGRWDAP